MEYIDLTKAALNPKYWRKNYVEYMSGHMHRNSPYETSHSCGNCDGARCKHCKKIEYWEFEFSAPYDICIDMVISCGIAKDIAENYIMDDFYRNGQDGYFFLWPSEATLEKDFPEFYQKLKEN